MSRCAWFWTEVEVDGEPSNPLVILNDEPPDELPEIRRRGRRPKPVEETEAKMRAPGRPPKRTRYRCPYCGKNVALDRLGRYVGHGLYNSCDAGWTYCRDR
jgi:hypothetical protein